MQFPEGNRILVAPLLEVFLDGKKQGHITNLDLSLDIKKDLMINVTSNKFSKNVILKDVELKNERLVLNLITVGQVEQTTPEKPIDWHPV